MRRLNIIYGILLGLAAARFLLEIPEAPVPVPGILALALVGGTAGFLLARRRPPTAGWPALVLLAAVLWPWQLSAPVWVSIWGLIGLMELSREGERPPLLSDRQADLLADMVVCASFLALYLVTLSRDVLPADSGEFQLVAALLGVAHPPGYPLYTMAGHLFIRLVPIGTPALRLNLMSVPMAVVTLLWLARATRLWARHLGASPLLARMGGLAAALTLGSATTFWAQATIANIRMPTLFFAALALYALARFAVDGTLGTGTLGIGQRDRALPLLALALGLGIGHHPSLGFVGIFFILYVLSLDPRLLLQPRRWWRPVLVFLAALLVPLAYLPLRGAAGAPLAPPDLDTLQGFLWHVLAKGFAGDMFAFANPQDFLHRLALLPALLTFQFNGLLLALALLGILTVLRRDWHLFLLLAGSFLLHTYVTLTYRAPQTVEYLMPAYLPVALSVGLLPAGWGKFSHPSPSGFAATPSPLLTRSQERGGGGPTGRGPSGRGPKGRGWDEEKNFSSRLRVFVVKTQPLLAALAVWAGLMNGQMHASLTDLASDTSTRQTVGPLLEAAPPGAVILADWHWATPLWYLQQVEGRRPDVTVEYVYPVVGEDYGATWLRWVEEIGDDRPLLLTHFYDFPGYSAEPVGAGFRFHRRPATEVTAPLSLTDITFAGGVQLVGYRLPAPPFRAGQPLEIVLAWRRTASSDRAPSFTLRLTDPDGRDVAQADRYLGAEVLPGEVRWERLVIPIYPTLRPGRYHLVLGAYTVSGAGFEPLLTPDGKPFTLLTELDVEPASRAPFTLHPQWVPYAGGPVLVGVDYDRTAPDTLRVYLRWRGPTDGGTLRLRAPGGAEGTATLPALPQGAYQTVAVDLPGTARGILLLSLTDGTGQERVAAGPWGWPLRRVPLILPPGDLRFVPLGDEMAVVGVQISRPAPGAVAAVDVTVVGLRALTNDNATSVRLMDETGRFLGAHDCQPALGTVPTLKWIAGSRIRDRHLIPIPADWAGGGVRATLVAYERFRMTPLPPMDDRRWEAVPLK